MQAVVAIEIGLIRRTAAVDVVEIERRRPEILERVRIVLALQAADRVERNVVVDELAEIRVSGADAGVLFIVRFGFGGGGRFELGGHGGAELVEIGFGVPGRGQVREQACESAVEWPVRGCLGQASEDTVAAVLRRFHGRSGCRIHDKSPKWILRQSRNEVKKKTETK